jgi:hypothetical protein
MLILMCVFLFDAGFSCLLTAKEVETGKIGAHNAPAVFGVNELLFW